MNTRTLIVTAWLKLCPDADRLEQNLKATSRPSPVFPHGSH
jgi:hypothetical protein